MRYTYSLKVTIFALIAFLSGFVIFPQKAQAEAWGTNFAAAVMKQTMENAYRYAEGAALGAAKVAAYQVLNLEVARLVGGTSSTGALYITDWYDYLTLEPRDEAELLLNDFLSQATRGQGTCDYVSASSSNVVESFTGELVSVSTSCFNEGVNFSQSYPSYLRETAENAVLGSGLQQYDLNEYCSDPSQMFAQGNWRCFNAFFSNPYNNPYGFTLQAEQYYSSQLSELQRIREAQAQAYGGFLPQRDQTGRVITPGTTIRDILSSVQNLGNLITSAANSPAEFASSLVTSYINRYITATIREGIGSVQSQINREIYNVERNINNEINEALDQVGPEYIYRPLY